MKRIPLLFLFLTLCCSSVFAGEKTVKLEMERNGVKVLIGKDVFTVFRFGLDRRKPLFYPVTGPNAYELLEKACKSSPPDAEGRKVVVVSEAAQLHKESGDPETAPFGKVLVAERVDGDKVYVAGSNAWIARADIAPVAGIVVRLINDNPTNTKNRKEPDFYDHVHHKGIWFAVDEIDGIKFWMEDSLVNTTQVSIVEQSGPTASFKYSTVWLSKEDKPVLEQDTLVTISADRLITYDATLRPAKDSVHIGDTKEGFFAIRLPHGMQENVSGGPVTNAEGKVGTKDTWGRPSPWIDYIGKVGEEKFGVTIMDAPQNPWKSRYHVRDYGLFSVNPFGDGAYTAGTPEALPAHKRDLTKGESLRFVYGLWVHGGDSGLEKVAEAYKTFANGIKK